MAEEDEESLRQRLTREREQRRDDGQLERFREGKFKPINPKQREQLERRMAQSDPPPALQRPPQPAAKVEAGLVGPLIAGKNLNLTVLEFVFLSDATTGFATISQNPAYEEIHYWRNGLYVGNESPEDPGAPAPADLVEQTVVNLVQTV